MKTILLAGATGRVGRQIAKAILERNTKLQLLVRPQTINSLKKQSILKPLLQSGATITEGDVTDLDSLKRAVEKLML